jgi:phospholipid/cholesterol/gamma-HCH transport system permease protein
LFERVGAIGSATRDRFGIFGGILALAYGAGKGFLLERGHGRRVFVRTIATQVYFTAVQPLPFFLLTALIFGFVVIVQADQVLPRYGLHHLVPNLVVTAVVREIAPLVIAMILIGRSGTAIATELGYMRLNQEIDALSVTGINLEYFIVLPRIVGVTAATLCLMIAFSTMAVVGGFVIGQTMGLVSVTLLFRELIGALTIPTMIYALAKALLFGIVIAATNCYHGLTVSTSFTEIPRAAGTGVIHSLAICFVLNALISVYAIL